MLTLITGVPGSGKTLNTIELVDKECKGREVYYRGIRDLTLDWKELSIEQCHDWMSLPDGAVIVIDEVQQVWPNLSNNKQSPASVTRLDTHRHRGFDFYIITQKPTMVDFRVRGFAGRHYHFERSFGRNGTRQLEWQKAISDPDDYHSRQDAQTTRIKFNKKYFEVYKSAEIHTVKKRIPKAFYYFAVAIIFTISAGVYAYQNIRSREHVDIETSAQVNTGNSILPSFGDDDAPLTTQQYIDQYKPRLSDLPFTAPVYDSVTEVKTYPRPQCLHRVRNDVCNCYTQQATPIDISHEQCINIVNNGWFNPFRDESQREEGGQALAAVPPQINSPSYRPNDKPNIIVLETGHSFYGNRPAEVPVAGFNQYKQVSQPSVHSRSMLANPAPAVPVVGF